MFTATKRQAALLKRLQIDARGAHDHLRAVRHIAGEPQDLVHALDFGPVVGNLAIAGTLQAIDALYRVLDDQIVTHAEVCGVHLPIYPAVEQRAAMHPDDVAEIHRGAHLPVGGRGRMPEPDPEDTEVFPRLREEVGVSARIVALHEQARAHYTHHVEREGSPDDDAVRADAAV